MEVKRIRTSKDEDFVEQLEDLIEKVKAGKVKECKIAVLLAEGKKEKPDVDDLTEEDCKRLLRAIFADADEDDEGEDEDECDGDCENCENYVEDDPEETFEDLGRAIGCLVYYGLSLPLGLVSKYNEAYMDILEKKHADD